MHPLLTPTILICMCLIIELPLKSRGWRLIRCAQVPDVLGQNMGLREVHGKYMRKSLLPDMSGASWWNCVRMRRYLKGSPLQLHAVPLLVDWNWNRIFFSRFSVFGFGLVVFFKKVFHYVIEPWLYWNLILDQSSLKFIETYPPSTGIKGMHHHTQHYLHFYKVALLKFSGSHTA